MMRIMRRAPGAANMEQSAAMTDKASNVSQPQDYKLIVEKDVQIPMRDGTLIYADVFRPDCPDKVPAIMNLSVYNKDKLWIPPDDLEEEPNPYMNWESANPLWWCPRGYAIVRVDSRGSGKSPGRSEPSSYAESLDYYDAVEWIAKRPWCSGNIGTLGISYLAASQWRLANLQPPSLKAMIPWEGRADQYRDQIYHGGIFALGFIGTWYLQWTANHLLGKPRSYNPDAFNNNYIWECAAHDLDSDYWRQCSADWDMITVPFYSAGNWTSHSLHLRGNTEAYMCARSPHKKLRIHSGTHFHAFYSEEGRLDQLRWFDYWLKGLDTGIMDEPPVKLEIRTGGKQGRYDFRFEDDWPIPRTEWTKWYLAIEREADNTPDGVEGQLLPDKPAHERKLTYAASAEAHGHGPAPRLGASFMTPPMEEATELTGPFMLNIWVSSTTEDADLMVTLRNIGRDGTDVWEVGSQGQPTVLTKGWLRASHRKLDPEKSLPFRPYHAHNERWWLEPDVPVECQVEIWPTSIVLQKGHRLRVDIQPQDGLGSSIYTHWNADYKLGARNSLYAGGDKASYLLVPIIPPKA
jgi:predicted acyl esterase